MNSVRKSVTFYSINDKCLAVAVLLTVLSLVLSQIKSKFRPRTDHEGPEEEYRYSCAMSLTSDLDG